MQRRRGPALRQDNVTDHAGVPAPKIGDCFGPKISHRIVQTEATTQRTPFAACAPRGCQARPSAANRRHARSKYETYVAMARDAAARGDTIEAESLYQHAEHYFRVLREQHRHQHFAAEPSRRQEALELSSKRGMALWRK